MARRPGPPREQIGARLRFEILRRCNFACFYCGIPSSLGLKVLHVDHVIPVALGGTNDPWNLVAACWDCNAGKANGVPTEEMIKAAYGDYCAYVESTDGFVTPCRFCSKPVQNHPDDDEQIQCDTCDAVMFYGYDAGAGNAREWVGP